MLSEKSPEVLTDAITNYVKSQSLAYDAFIFTRKVGHVYSWHISGTPCIVYVCLLANFIVLNRQ